MPASTNGDMPLAMVVGGWRTRRGEWQCLLTAILEQADRILRGGGIVAQLVWRMGILLTGTDWMVPLLPSSLNYRLSALACFSGLSLLPTESFPGPPWIQWQ